MRGKLSRCTFGVVLLLCMSFLARGTTIISGPTVVCVGSTDAYTAFGHSGSPLYKWSVNTAGVARVVGTLATANVTWNTTGSYVLKVVVDSLGLPIDSTTLSVTVVSPPSPYITTSSRVACQAYDTAKYGPDPPHVPLILSDTDGCIKVCSNSVVKYYANGILPTDKLTWTVSGGIILSASGDSVTVQWGTVNPAGRIMVTDSSLGGCIGSYKVCIDIIAKPKASFTVDSATIPVSSYNICLGAKTQFNDLSTVAVGGTISNWYWIFGDGTTSSEQNPSHTFPKGFFTVKEVVTNQCGCTDTFTVTLNVSKTRGPNIYVCPRPTIVCQGDTVTYYTDNCGAPGSYNWSWNPLYAHAIGTPPYTNSSITLMWDSANADGYGTVSLGVTCTGSCTGITTLKVPVIQRNPTVTGPPVSQKLCVGVPYNFSIPLWPGTRYNWGVIRDSSAIIGGRHSNSVSVQFATPGTYTIHVWYQNALTLCGSDVKFKVTVVSPTSIIGKRTICLDSTVPNIYTLSGSYPATWTISGPGGYTYVSTFTGSFTFPTVSIPGVYALSASGPDFCTPGTAYINVIGSVPAIDFMTGTFSVCFGRPYTYVAHNDLPGYSYQWSVSGGTATKLTGDSITVTWSSAGSISVQRLNAGGGCPGATLSRPIRQVNLFTDVNLQGPDTVCANGTDIYNDNLPGADVTTWSIYPDSLGSVISGNYTSNVNVLWNNVHTKQVADLIVTVTECGTIVHDTLKVTIKPNPTITVTGPAGAQCRDNLLSFTASLPPTIPYPTSYTWSFGDLTNGTSTTNTTTHAYFPPVSAGTGAVSYMVKVIANGSDPSCPVEGVGTTTVQVYPGTFPSISSSSPLSYCGTMPHVAINSSVANVSGTVTYAWYRKFPTTLVGTGSTYTTAAPDSGTYFLVTHDATGCFDTSNFITIFYTGGCGTCPKPHMTLTNLCNGKISGSTTASAGILWTVTPGGFTSVSANPTFTFSSPGYYQFDLSTLDSCIVRTDSAAVDSVGLIVGLYWDWTCPGAGANYIVNLHDNSQKLPDWHYTGETWTIQTLPTGTAYSSSSTSFSQALPPGTYLVTYQVVAAGGSSSQNCAITDTLVVPGKPSFSITELRSPICEGVPIVFTPVESGTTPPTIRSYSWDFGDGSGSLVPNTERTYTWKSPFSPNHNAVNLTVIDSLGCSFTATSVTDTIYQNRFIITGGGSVVGGPVTACDGSSVTLSYNPAVGSPTVTSYLWTDGTTNSTDIVATSGNYNVAVYDIHQCRYVPGSPASVTILSPTALLITGARKVCYPNPVVLSDDLGSGYTYQWYRNGSFLVGTSGTLIDNITPGTYTYKLVVTTTFGATTCHDTSGTVTVVVEPQPAAPVINSITAVSCPLYQLAMTVSPTVTGFSYTWSNGAHGATDTINNGGAYRVWVTDTNGCVNYADTLIPYSPASYLAWFPVGCYNLCYQTLPDSLYGPSGTFTWNWLYNGGGIAGGTNTAITPLALNSPVYGPGDYQLSLANVFCSVLSDTLNITMGDCGPGSGCPPLFPGNPLPSIVCDTNAAGYIVTIPINTPPAGVTSLTFGFDIGPAVPFTVYPSGGIWPSSFTFSFSTLTVPPPATALVKVIYDAGLGHPCMDTERINLLPCSWPSEKMTPADTAQPQLGNMQQAATGMVAYPNPADHALNVNYNFGYAADRDRRIVLYDVLGRRISEQKVTDVTGTIRISLSNVVAGAYIVRMTEDGNTVHVAHISVTH